MVSLHVDKTSVIRDNRGAVYLAHDFISRVAPSEFSSIGDGCLEVLLAAPNNGTPLTPEQLHKQQQTKLNQKCAVAAATSATLATTSALNAGAAVITAPAVVPGLIFGGIAAVEGVGAGLLGIYAAYACYNAAQF